MGRLFTVLSGISLFFSLFSCESQRNSRLHTRGISNPPINIKLAPSFKTALTKTGIIQDLGHQERTIYRMIELIEYMHSQMNPTQRTLVLPLATQLMEKTNVACSDWGDMPKGRIHCRVEALFKALEETESIRKQVGPSNDIRYSQKLLASGFTKLIAEYEDQYLQQLSNRHFGEGIKSSQIKQNTFLQCLDKPEELTHFVNSIIETLTLWKDIAPYRGEPYQIHHRLKGIEKKLVTLWRKIDALFHAKLALRQGLPIANEFIDTLGAQTISALEEQDRHQNVQQEQSSTVQQTNEDILANYIQLRRLQQALGIRSPSSQDSEPTDWGTIRASTLMIKTNFEIENYMKPWCHNDSDKQAEAQCYLNALKQLQDDPLAELIVTVCGALSLNKQKASCLRNGAESLDESKTSISIFHPVSVFDLSLNLCGKIDSERQKYTCLTRSLDPVSGLSLVEHLFGICNQFPTASNASKCLIPVIEQLKNEPLSTPESILRLATKYCAKIESSANKLACYKKALPTNQRTQQQQLIYQTCEHVEKRVSKSFAVQCLERGIGAIAAHELELSDGHLIFGMCSYGNSSWRASSRCFDRGISLVAANFLKLKDSQTNCQAITISDKAKTKCYQNLLKELVPAIENTI